VAALHEGGVRLEDGTRVQAWLGLGLALG
jgi:hypothetical protein